MATKSEALVYRLQADKDRLQKDLNKAQAHLAKFQGQSAGISRAVNTSMLSMFGAFSAGIIARDVFNTVTSFEKQMDKVKAISGATDSEFQELTDSAIELGRESKFTAGEIGKLQEELARLGFSSEEITSSTDAIRQLATVADAELGESARSLAGTMNAFNLVAGESNEVANIMSESFSKSALDLEKFTVGMSNVGATANAAGFDLAQTTAMLGTLTNANIDASKAGTDLRKIFTELSLQNLTLEEAFNRINNSTDKVKTAFEIFGQRAQTSAIILAENAEKTQKLHGELSDANKEMGEMVAIMEDNLITDLQKLKSAWDGLILSIEKGDGTISKVFRTMTTSVTQLLNRMADSDWKGFFSGSGLTQRTEEIDKQAQLLEDQKSKLNQINVIVENTKFATENMTAAQAIRRVNEELAMLSGHEFYEDIRKELLAYQSTLKETIKQQQLFAASRVAVGSNVDTLGTEVIKPQLDTSSITLSDNTSFFQGLEDKFETDFAAFKDRMTELNTELNSILEDTLTNAIAGIAEGLATDGLSGAFDNLKQVLGTGMQQIGKLMIAHGVAMLALRKSLESLNPVPALVAGAALVAIGAAISNSSSNLSNKMGGGGSSSRSSGTGSFQGNLTGQSIQLSGELKASGRDLVYVIGEQEKANNRLRG